METGILIVGAGPSGAAAAVQLGQLGIKDVLLMDRERFPRDKTCGSGLSPAALHVAEALGIGPELRRRANPVRTVRFVTPAGEVLRVPANSAAVILLRKEFDHLLVQRALSLGVGFRDRWRAMEAIEENRRLVGVRGHPIVHTTWVANVSRPGALLIGEAARLTHNGTGEGIRHAMQSVVYAADAVARVVRGEATEPAAWRGYVHTLRRRFTPEFATGHLLRGLVSDGMLDRLARTYNSESFQRAIHWIVGAALTGSTTQEAPAAYGERTQEETSDRPSRVA